MAVATVDIQVNSQGAVSSIRNVNAAASQLENQINNTNRSVKQLETAFAGLGVAVAGMNALNIAKDFFATANAADAAQRRIKMVSTGLDDYRLVMQTARNASAKFGLSQTEAANAVADIYTRLRPVGFGLSEINAIYEGFNTAVKLSSVEAGAASAAFMQLSQGLGSGTLQGDELRSVLEQMPSIAQAIAKEMDINVGSIKKFGSEGKITADVIVRALDRIRTEGAEKLATAMDTPQQKIVALGNAMEDFKVAVASDVAPVVIGAIGQITVAIQNATQFVTDLRTGFGLLAGAFSGVASGIGSINTALSGTIGKFRALGQSKGLMMLLNFMTLGGANALASLAGAGARKNANKPFAAPIGPEMPIRLSMQGLDLGGGGGKAGKTNRGAANKAANDAARLAEQTKTQLAAAFKMNALAAADLDIQVSMTKEEKLQGEFDKTALERRVKFLDLQKNAKSEAERQALASAQLSEILIANNKYAKDKKDLLEQQTTELYRQLDVSGILDKNLQKRLSGAFTGGAATGTFRTDIDLMPGLTGGKAGKKIEDLKTQIAELTNIGNIAITSAEGIGNAFANSFQGLIDGSMSAREALSSFFKDVASMFLDMAAQIIAKQMTMIILQTILKALGAVTGGGGKISDLNAPASINNPLGNLGNVGGAYAKGGVFGNGISKFAAGGIVGSPTLFQFANGGTTQTGLMGEAGPEAIMPLSRGAGGKLGVNASGLREAMGGAPGMGGSPVLNMSFETTRFGGTDYVSRDQLEAAMAQTRRQASSDGAKRGMSMTLDRLQQSPQTRSRVGLR